MGTSGTAIFSDDTASDVRRDFVDLLRRGWAAEEALKVLLRDWSDSLEDSDDGPVFWLALASTQWDYGCLTEDVKQRAIAVVEGGANLPRWSEKQLDKRRAVLAELKDKLLSAQPKPRRPRKLKHIEPPPRYEVKAPDGLGKAVAFWLCVDAETLRSVANIVRKSSTSFAPMSRGCFKPCQRMKKRTQYT
jgi:hypothetical protein